MADQLLFTARIQMLKLVENVSCNLMQNRYKMIVPVTCKIQQNKRHGATNERS